MSLKYGKRELAKIIAALEQDHETVDEAAAAVMEVAEAIFEQRAKFVVVGQLQHSKVDGYLTADDPRAIKVSLGWYSTEGEARSAAESLWTSTVSGDTYRCWVLPVHHGTPASLHAKRKAEIAEWTEAQKDKALEKVRADIEKRQREEAERARAEG